MQAHFILNAKHKTHSSILSYNLDLVTLKIVLQVLLIRCFEFLGTFFYVSASHRYDFKWFNRCHNSWGHMGLLNGRMLPLPLGNYLARIGALAARTEGPHPYALAHHTTQSLSLNTVPHSLHSSPSLNLASYLHSSTRQTHKLLWIWYRVLSGPECWPSQNGW